MPKRNRKPVSRVGSGNFIKPKGEQKPAAQQSAARTQGWEELDDDEAQEMSQKLRDSHRTYGDRLSEGFGMIGGD